MVRPIGISDPQYQQPLANAAPKKKFTREQLLHLKNSPLVQQAAANVFNLQDKERLLPFKAGEKYPSTKQE